MSVKSVFPEDEPLFAAYEKYKGDGKFENGPLRWLPGLDGALWAAFEAGWRAGLDHKERTGFDSMQNQMRRALDAWQSIVRRMRQEQEQLSTKGPKGRKTRKERRKTHRKS